MYTQHCFLIKNKKHAILHEDIMPFLPKFIFNQSQPFEKFHAPGVCIRDNIYPSFFNVILYFICI